MVCTPLSYNLPATKLAWRFRAGDTLRGDRLLYEAVSRRSPWPIQADPADLLWRNRHPSLAGSAVATAYGLLAMYTTATRLTTFLGVGALGNPAYGCWLTPEAHSACMASPNLGINHPADFCILVDVRSIPAIWGPGTSRPSGNFTGTWRGGAIEFFVPQPIDVTLITSVSTVEPCGDCHR
jgi:hypothetical protein